MMQNPYKAIKYISYHIDDAQNDTPFSAAEHPHTVLVGWQCGFEPLFVAAHSYLPKVKLPSEDAIALATDLLVEKNWFGEEEPTEPDYILLLPNSTPLEKARAFLYEEFSKAGFNFDIDICLHDIERIYGLEARLEIGIEHRAVYVKSGLCEDGSPTPVPVLSGGPASETEKLRALKYAMECVAGREKWVAPAMSSQQIADYILNRLFPESEQLQQEQQLKKHEEIEQRKTWDKEHQEKLAGSSRLQELRAATKQKQEDSDKCE